MQIATIASAVFEWIVDKQAKQEKRRKMVKSEIGGNWVITAKETVKKKLQSLRAETKRSAAIENTLDEWWSMKTPSEKKRLEDWVNGRLNKRQLAWIRLVARFRKNRKPGEKIPDKYRMTGALLQATRFEALKIKGLEQFYRRSHNIDGTAAQALDNARPIKPEDYVIKGYKFACNALKIHPMVLGTTCNEIVALWANTHVENYILKTFGTEKDPIFLALNQPQNNFVFKTSWKTTTVGRLPHRYGAMEFAPKIAIADNAKLYLDAVVSLVHRRSLKQLALAEGLCHVKQFFSNTQKLELESLTPQYVYHFARITWGLDFLKPLITHVDHLAFTGQMTLANANKWTFANIVSSYFKSHSARLIAEQKTLKDAHAMYQAYLKDAQLAFEGTRCKIYKLHGKMERIALAANLGYQSFVLQHCVGGFEHKNGRWQSMFRMENGRPVIKEMGMGYEYLQSILNGHSQIFTVHDKVSLYPLATMQLFKSGNDVAIRQFYGERNGRVPDHLNTDLRQFFKELISKYQESGKNLINLPDAYKTKTEST